MSSTAVDHSWAEWRGQGSDGESRIVMDPWGKGPAIFAEDGAFSSNEHEVKGNHHYSTRRKWREDSTLRKASKK